MDSATARALSVTCVTFPIQIAKKNGDFRLPHRHVYPKCLSLLFIHIGQGSCRGAVVVLSSAEMEDDWVPVRLYGALHGRFCEVLARGRAPVNFTRGSVLYEPGFNENLLFIVHRGVLFFFFKQKTAYEIIYDLRKSGDVA